MAKKRKKAKARKVSRPRYGNCPAALKRVGMAAGAVLAAGEAIRDGATEAADTNLTAASDDLAEILSEVPENRFPDVERYHQRIHEFQDKLRDMKVGDLKWNKDDLTKEAYSLGSDIHVILLEGCG